MEFGYPDNPEVSFNGLNLEIGKGERFGLFGPNGAGKTTLMNLMTGVLKITRGSISLLGHDISRHDKSVNKLFGFVPQDFSFYQELSPAENLEFFGSWCGLNRQQISQRTDELLNILGLEDVRDKQVQKFSGGMKRRVNLAIGVIHKPEVLFLDEPTVGVDGTTLIYTSHQLSEAEGLCEQVALLDAGKIITQGNINTLLKDHQHETLEELFIDLTGQSSRQLVSALSKIGMFKVFQTAKNGQAGIAGEMNDEDAMLGIVVPADFSKKVTSMSKNVAGKAINSFGLEGDTVKNGDASIDPLVLYYNPILQENVRLSVKGALQSALQMDLPEKLENEMLNNHAAINDEPVSKDGMRRTPNATQHNVPAWTIFAMFFVIMSLGSSVVREKVSGSFIRLKTLPTNYFVGLLSKQITYMGVTMLQALCIGHNDVNLWMVRRVFADTQEQANGFGAVSIVILAAVGGLMVPSFAMQGFFKVGNLKTWLTTLLPYSP
eukprot:gene853-857_t